MLTHQQYESNWKEIKGGIRNLWGHLSDQEIESAKGNLTELTGVIEERYHESKDEIKNKLDKLMDSFDNDTDKNLDPDVSSYQRSPITSESHFGTGTGEADAQDETLHDKNFDMGGFKEDRIARH